MIQISAIVTDRFGAPVVVPNLFMEILDSTGRRYWKLGLIQRNSSGFSKLIATNELKANTRYTVRVSTNRKLIHMGFAYFKTKKESIIGFIPFLIAPLVLMPHNVLIPEKAKIPIFITYKTELDSRVCPICEPNEGLVFNINDKNLIRIGAPQLGGDTHYGCRCHYNMSVAINPALVAIRAAIQAVNVVTAVKKHIEKEMLITV